MRTLICPYINNCRIYKSWSEDAKERALNIIHKSENNYSCEALDTTNIFTSEDVEKFFIKDIEELDFEIECSHIELLNLLNKLSKK